MYLVSLYEQDTAVEASLGGRVTADEILAFGEELAELLEGFAGQPFSLLLDYSKTKRLDPQALDALHAVKDNILALGGRIVSVAPCAEDRVAHETARLQQVMEGTESFSDMPRLNLDEGHSAKPWLDRKAA